jgi:hypothetical protein
MTTLSRMQRMDTNAEIGWQTRYPVRILFLCIGLSTVDDLTKWLVCQLRFTFETLGPQAS